MAAEEDGVGVTETDVRHSRTGQEWRSINGRLPLNLTVKHLDRIPLLASVDALKC